MALCVPVFGQKWSRGMSYMRRWLQRNGLGILNQLIFSVWSLIFELFLDNMITFVIQICLNITPIVETSHVCLGLVFPIFGHLYFVLCLSVPF